MNLRSPERLVRLATLGVRCVEYSGHDAADDVEVLSRPVEGLVVRVRGSQEVPLYHEHNSVYGFLRQTAGPVVVEIVDPLGRYLSRTIAHTVDSRLAEFRTSFEAGGIPDTTGWNPFVTAPLFPKTRGALPSGSTGVFGTVSDATGTRIPFAHVQCSTASGFFRTHADENGDYFVRLIHARSGIDALSGGRDPNISRTITVHRPAVVRPKENFLRDYPGDFEHLRPGTAAFNTLWVPVAGISAAPIALKVGVLNRFDIG